MKKSNSLFISLSIRIMVIVILCFGVGFFFADNVWYFAKGLILGIVFTILKLKLMENTFSKAVVQVPHKATTYVKFHYFIRYTLTLLVLTIGVLEPTISLVGVIIPMIAMKIAAYWHGYKEPPTPKDGSVEFLEWEDDEEPSDF